jgi:hypothetical protein
MIARLTDRPRPLAEMKPDVPWPAAVQVVMDKVLERDVSARYQSSSEFGRELYKAVSAMRGSGATKQVTAVVAAPAAVGVPPAPPRAAGTRPVPATRLNPATPAQAAKAVPAAPKNKLPLVVVGIVLLIAVGGGAAVVLKQKGSNSNAAIPQGGTQLRQPVTTPLAVKPVALAPAFEQIEPLTDLLKDANKQTATRAIQMLDSIAPLARTNEDSVHVLLLRAEANVVLGQQIAACKILTNNEGRASKLNSRIGERVLALLKACP